MIPKKIIDKILELSKVEEVISEFLYLKKTGVNYKAKSPFSNERNPSLIVSPLKQIWKDFSSGKGGNVVNFLMEHEKFNFIEAIKYLAKKYNIKINNYKKNDYLDSLNKESLFIINKYANFFFIKNLNKKCHDFFLKRKFNLSIINKYEIGYAPNNYNEFTNSALKKGFKLKFLKKSGLVNNKTNNDFFINRIIFPIHSLSGVIIGFGGRSLSKKDYLAKYINSPENEIYHKGDNLYGIYQAKKYIIKYDFCYLTEGYTDVISMSQFGIKNVVATLGTSLTINQILLIKRFTKNITIIYDSDEAGINSCLRIIDLLLEEDMNIKIISLPEKEDPDSFFRKRNYQDIIFFLKKNTLNFLQFKIQILIKKKENKIFILKNIINSLLKISDLIKREIYLKEVSNLLKINEQTLWKEIDKLKFLKKKNPSKSINLILKSSKELNPLIILEKKLFQISLLYGNTKLISNNILKKKTSIIEEFIFQIKKDNIIFILKKNNYIFNFLYKKYLNGDLKSLTNPKILDQNLIKLISLIDKYEFDFFNQNRKKISQYFIEILLRYKSYYISNIIKNKLILLQKDKKLSYDKKFLLKIMNLTKKKNNINKKLNIFI
ncbi:MAG: DNA primase [Candidatus Karelsulcia muelleri]